MCRRSLLEVMAGYLALSSLQSSSGVHHHTASFCRTSEGSSSGSSVVSCSTTWSQGYLAVHEWRFKVGVTLLTAGKSGGSRRSRSSFWGDAVEALSLKLRTSSGQIQQRPWNRKDRRCCSYAQANSNSWQERPPPRFAGSKPRVIVVTSGKGGVGKTTTTANIGMCLARLNYKVVLIDADVGLRNLDLLLGLEHRVNYTAMDVFGGDCRLDQALIKDKRYSNFELLCISKPRHKIAMGFGGQALQALVDGLVSRPTGSPDFILIDCPAGIDAGFITAITPAQEAILVTTPDITSLRDADRVIGLLECDGITQVWLMINRLRPSMVLSEDMMDSVDIQDMLGLPLLGVIPEDEEVIRSSNRGIPLVLTAKTTVAGMAFDHTAWNLVEMQTMKATPELGVEKKGIFSFLGRD